jgi:hypothetical protein
MCAGSCVPLPLPEWSEAILLWSGPAAEAPSCPSWAPVVASNYHADLMAAPPLTCGACACDSPAGSCTLPATFTADNQPLCAGNSTTFDAPAPWTGACTVANAILAGKLCNGSPCVQSLFVAPLTLNESGCMPSVAPLPSAAPPEPATWNTAAVVCVGKPSGLCSDPGETCAPVVPDPSPGFRVCIVREGDRACPEGWSDKHVFFDHVNDDRTCSPCTCSAPAGSSCAGSISVFKESDCSSPLLMLSLDATGPSCVSVPSGSALGSKSAGPVTYTPGTCASGGGESLGATAPAEPSTFCCRP